MVPPDHDFDLTPEEFDGVVEPGTAHVAIPSPPHFESLVENAVDFFRRAFEEISTKPKSSVINFYNAIELVLKARLLYEHWSLVVSKPEKASISSFNSGDFQSVTLDEAVHRLENICGEDLGTERACFDSIRKHRNRLVHFFHPAYVATPDPEAIANVAAEQCRGWLFLHRLLTDKWADKFAPFADAIEQLDSQIHKNREFLSVKLELVTPELERFRTAGIAIEVCRSCGLQASWVKYVEPLRSSTCLVCTFWWDRIVTLCPECEKAEVEFADTGHGTCLHCDTSFDITDLLAEYAPGPSWDPKEDIQNRWYCSQCERADTETVVPWNGEFLCLNCAETFSRTGHCGYCGTPVAGFDEDSYLVGCVLCDGRYGDDRD
jgi:hypothetical protein